MPEHRFTIRGADNREYPASAETVKSWIRDGRVTRDMMVFDRTSNAWSRAGDLAELFEQAPPVVAEIRAAQQGSNALVGIIVVGVLGLIIWFCGGEVNNLRFASFLGVALFLSAVVLLIVWFARRGRVM